MGFLEYFELMTNYQINSLIFTILIVAFVISGLFFYYTNDIKTTAVTFFSILLVPILTGCFLLILYKLFNVIPSEKHSLIFWCTLLISAINLSTLVGKYSIEVVKKGFDIDHVTRHHFSATLNLFVTILLVNIAVSVFVESNILIILLGILIVSSLTLWFNHLIARLLLKDK